MLALLASKLERAANRLALEATCRTLLAASRGEHGGMWWGGSRLQLSMRTAGGDSFDGMKYESWKEAEQALVSLAGWRPAAPHRCC